MKFYIWSIVKHRDMVLLGKKAAQGGKQFDIWYPPGIEVEESVQLKKYLKEQDFENEYLTNLIFESILKDFNIEVIDISSMNLKLNYTPVNGELPNINGKLTEFIFLEYNCIYKFRTNIPNANYIESRWVMTSELSSFPMFNPQKNLFIKAGLLK